MKLRKYTIIKFLIILFFSSAFSYNFFVTEYRILNSSSIKNTYISDETWYVSASRNLLRVAFHMYPRSSNATLKFKSVVDLAKFNGLYSSKFDFIKMEPYVKIKNSEYAIGKNITKVMMLIREKNKYNISIVQPGWKYPDKEGILNYLNLEHPPVGKYFIMYQILQKDVPMNWRIPSMVLGSLVVFIVPIALLIATDSFWLSFLSMLLLYFDEPLRAMSMVAMLDIYAASFSVMSFSALLFEPYTATVLYAIASSSKYTAFFYFIPLAYVFWLERKKSPAGSVLRPLMTFVIVLTLTSLPIILGLGFENWLKNLIGGIEWFLVSRPSGPPPSTPWDWIVGTGKVPLSVKPTLEVYTNPTVIQLAIIAFFLLLPLRKKKLYRAPWLASFYLISALLGFQAIYWAGNHTLYAFYTVVFTPFADVAAAGLAISLMNYSHISEALQWWWSVIKRSWQWLWGKKRLECKLV